MKKTNEGKCFPLKFTVFCFFSLHREKKTKNTFEEKEGNIEISSKNVSCFFFRGGDKKQISLFTTFFREGKKGEKTPKEEFVALEGNNKSPTHPQISYFSTILWKKKSKFLQKTNEEKEMFFPLTVLCFYFVHFTEKKKTKTRWKERKEQIKEFLCVFRKHF